MQQRCGSRNFLKTSDNRPLMTLARRALSPMYGFNLSRPFRNTPMRAMSDAMFTLEVCLLVPLSIATTVIYGVLAKLVRSFPTLQDIPAWVPAVVAAALWLPLDLYLKRESDAVLADYADREKISGGGHAAVVFTVLVLSSITVSAICIYGVYLMRTATAK